MSILWMKALLPLVALIVAALPVKASGDVELKEKQAYFYGFITGVGATLCGAVKDEQITKEYAQYFLPTIVEEISKDARGKNIGPKLKQAQNFVMKTDGCKGVFQ